MFRNRIPKGRVLLEVKVPFPWLMGVLVAVVVVVILAAVGLALAYTNSCSACHIIKPEVATYERTAHYRAGVACQQCHTKPGVFNYLIRNLQGATNIILYASNSYQRPLTTAVGTASCVQCHPKSQLERDQVFNNIRVNHTGLREAGYQCTACHADISHPGTQQEVARVAQNKMPICARCHDGKQLPDDCNICHVGGAPPEEINVPIEGKVPPSQCVGCHRSRTICADCHHGLLMPHPVGWIKAHGPIVVDRGKIICASCHTKQDPTFCIDCHGVIMPHPGGWRAVGHTIRGRTDPRSVRQMPRQGQLHPVPRPADATSVRVALHAPQHGAQFAGPVQQVPQPVLLRGLPRRRVAAQWRLHRGSPEPRLQPGQHLHEVPRQRRHGASGLLRRPVPQRLYPLSPRSGPRLGSVSHDR